MPVDTTARIKIYNQRRLSDCLWIYLQKNILKGKIWLTGYEKGELQGQLYEDAVLFFNRCLSDGQGFKLFKSVRAVLNGFLRFEFGPLTFGRF